MTEDPWPQMRQMPRLARWGLIIVTGAVASIVVWLLWTAKTSDDVNQQVAVLKAAGSVAAGTVTSGFTWYTLRLTRRRDAQSEANQAHQRLSTDRSRADGRLDRAVDLICDADPERRRNGFAELDRLGRQHPELRQDIVDQIRTYLRKPFTMPQDCATPAKRDQATRELEVRARAQKILTDNLRDPARETDCEWHLDPAEDHEPWDVELDLSGTILINISFAGCRLKLAKFVGVEFRGDCGFDYSVFEGPTTFEDAMFDATAGFQGVEFLGTVLFWRTHFGEFAWFMPVLCHGQASFSGAYFAGMSQLGYFQTTGYGSIDFAGVVVQKPGPFNSWPEGWREVPAAGGTATVKRVADQEPQTSTEVRQ